jgi:hypothetical protein
MSCKYIQIWKCKECGLIINTESGFKPNARRGDHICDLVREGEIIAMVVRPAEEELKEIEKNLLEIREALKKLKK